MGVIGSSQEKEPMKGQTVACGIGPVFRLRLFMKAAFAQIDFKGGL